jgi:regulator-associated protein of mTOR
MLYDGSPLVRKELVVALSGFVSQFETQFAAVAFQFSEAEKDREYHTVTGTVGVYNSPNEAAFVGMSGMRRSMSSRCLTGMLSPMSATAGIDAFEQQSGTVKRIASTSSMLSSALSSYSGIYTNVWKVLLSLSLDPSPSVSDMAKKLINYIRHKASAGSQPRQLIQQRKSSIPISAPSSPSSRTGAFMPKQPQAGEPQMKAESPEASRPITLRLDQTTTPLRSSICVTNGASAIAATVAAPAIPQYMRQRLSLASDSISERDEELSGALLSTEFFEWCCKYFTEPVMSTSPENDPHGAARYEHEYRFQRAAQMQRLSQDEQRRAKGSRLDESIFINRSIGVPGVLRFHPYEPHLVVADKDHISIWDWEQPVKLSTFSVRNPRHTRITHAEFLNAHDQAHILTASDDGSVKVWRNYYSEMGSTSPDMLTSWQALTDMLPIAKGSGMVVHWDQSSGLLYTSGDVRIIRIWDTQKELRVQDLPTGADSCMTSLSLNTGNTNLIVGGCGDGTVRIFDKRLPPNDCTVQVFHEHQTWVVKAYTLQSYPDRVVSASINGDVRLWDIRGKESFKVINTSPGLTAMDAHQQAEIIACGSVQQYIGVYNYAGENLSTVKYHEGFMGQRIGPVTCLAFHPLRVKLAVGSEDQFVSIYSMPNSKKR